MNRTNRMLSANSNRLNLGTRSLALTMGGNNMGQDSLHVRPAHPSRMDAQRVGIVPGIGYPIPGVFLVPMIPGSSSVSFGLVQSSGIKPRVEAVVEAPPAVGPVVEDDRACLAGRARGLALPTSPAQAVRSWGRFTPGVQRTSQAWQGRGLAGATARATRADVAAPRGAASGG